MTATVGGGPAQERAADAQHRLLLAHHPHAVVLVETDGTVVEANPAAAALVGGAPLLGRRMSDVVELVDRDRAATALAAAASVGTQQVDLTVRRPDGALLELRVTLVSVPGSDPVTTLVVAEDVTTLRHLASELEAVRSEAAAAQEARADFVARTNHEIRTPLTSILAVAELLADTTDPDEQRELVRTLERSSQRLLRLIDNVLEFGAGEEAVDERAFEEFDLHALVHDAVSLVGASARRKGLPLTVHLDDDVPRWVRDHPTWTLQVLGNLLSNAVAFTEEGDVQLHVGLVRTPGPVTRVSYTVSDTGIGIPPSQAELLFAPFERPPRDDNHGSRGVGLGLSIVQQLVTMSGGTVGFTSTPGVGSTFTVVLPLRSARG